MNKQKMIEELRQVPHEDMAGALYDSIVAGAKDKVDRDSVIALMFDMKLGQVDDIPKLIGIHAAYAYLSNPKRCGLGPLKNWIQGRDVIYREVLWSWLKMVHGIDAKTYLFEGRNEIRT